MLLLIFSTDSLSRLQINMDSTNECFMSCSGDATSDTFQLVKIRMIFVDENPSFSISISMVSRSTD
jgi:hypothetical protein